MPREFLVSVGLAVLLQFIIVIALLLAPAWRPRRQVTRTVLIYGSAILATAALAYPLGRWIGWWDWWLLLVFVGAIATFGAFLLLLASAFASGDADRLRSGVVVILVAFAIFVPWRVALEWFSLEGLDVRVCLMGQEAGALDGLFIGENETSVYIGETDTDQPRIAEIPRGEVERVYLGKGAQDVTCATPTTAG